MCLTVYLDIKVIGQCLSYLTSLFGNGDAKVQTGGPVGHDEDSDDEDVVPQKSETTCENR